MDTALTCLRNVDVRRIGRMAVADFTDGTGAMEGGTQQSRTFSQRTDMMMISALAEAGAEMVNRSSVAVSEWELKNAMEKKLGDGKSVKVENQTLDYRPVKAGVILGSKYYITGAITELNWNIDSVVAEGGAFSFQGGKRTYRISIAIDVMVTDTETTSIVFAKSYKKQLVGYETTAGFFRFVGTPTVPNPLVTAASVIPNLELFDANLGEKQNEPTQAALRWLISLSAYDVLRNLTHKGEACDAFVPGGALTPIPPLNPQPTPVAEANAGAKSSPTAAGRPDAVGAPDNDDKRKRAELPPPAGATARPVIVATREETPKPAPIVRESGAAAPRGAKPSATRANASYDRAPTSSTARASQARAGASSASAPVASERNRAVPDETLGAREITRRSRSVDDGAPIGLTPNQKKKIDAMIGGSEPILSSDSFGSN